MKKSRINSKLQILDEWSNLFENKHYILAKIENNLLLIEIILNWKDIPKP